MRRTDATRSGREPAPRKRRRRSIIAFEMVRLNREASEPLHEQLYRQIRDELEAGDFEHASSRLPSSRALALDLGVSRLTVKLAFAKLRAEGYLRARKGSGTFVAERLPNVYLSAEKSPRPPPAERAPRIARRVLELQDPRTPRQLDFGVTGPPGISFMAGEPAIDEFPIAIWERLRAKVLAQKGAHLLRYASSRGETDLRKALAAYLCDFRGARCHADQIVVVAGMQQAMLLCALALVNPGEPAWIEDPGYHHARRAFAFAGARVVPRPLDREGMVLTGVSKRSAPKLIYVTPSHQFPLGITMSLKRRRALIEFGRRHDAYILEDDYNSEFRFDGPPLPCLQGWDNVGRVIYAGTLSKILFPSARIAYLIVPEQMVESLVKIRSVMDQHSPPIDQATLACFITDGYFLSHVKRMRKDICGATRILHRPIPQAPGETFHSRRSLRPACTSSPGRSRDKDFADFQTCARDDWNLMPSQAFLLLHRSQAARGLCFWFRRLVQAPRSGKD